MTWTDERIRAALDGASAVVQRLHDALRVIGLRTADLLSDTATTDGDARQRPNGVGANQLAHAFIVCALVHVLIAAGWSPGQSAAAMTLGWGVLWEGVQYLRAMASGRSRTRILRDWMADAAAYLTGAGLALAQVSGVPSAIFLTTGIAGLQALVSALAFGRTREEGAR
jgi:hypothetical protein